MTISGVTYTTTSAYNERGELTSLTYPDSTVVDREYTDRGELYRLKHASTVIDTRGYDDGGRMTSSAYNNGVSESRSYGTDNTLSSISFTGASIGNLSYAWDDNKNKTAETIGGTMSGYGFSVGSSGYDNEDRLVNFNRTDGNLDQSWSLSNVGDWNSVTTEGTAQSRTHGPTHELTAVAGSSVSTDVKGNVTLIPAAARPNAQSLLLNWDFDNRLSTADVGNNSSVDVTYKFDALGRRVYRQDSSSTTIYVQAGQQTIADYVSGAAASSPTYRYVYASYIDEPVFRYKPTGSESIYFHRNQQYSIIALTNGSGSIVERYAYSAYGVPTIADSSGSVLTSSAYSNRYTYTGREWDPVLLMYHYRARMYDANLGRFCSRDPIGYEGSEWNLCAYLGNRVLSNLDPSGLVNISCSCFRRVNSHGGPTSSPALEPFQVVVDCQNMGDKCCSNACQEEGATFGGVWELVGADSDPYPIFDVIDGALDGADNMICVSMVVADVVTVPSGEGVAGCVAVKTIFRTVKKCIRRTFKNKCKWLKEVKEAACAASNGMSCGNPPTCKGLSAAECHNREMLHLSCASARGAYQATCFKKGPSNPEFPGHKQAIRTAIQAARNCAACAIARS